MLWKAGNGDDLQMVYVAFSPSLGIVVAHQGERKRFAMLIQSRMRELKFSFRHKPIIGR